jgi:hypothetical protein
LGIHFLFYFLYFALICDKKNFDPFFQLINQENVINHNFIWELPELGQTKLIDYLNMDVQSHIFNKVYSLF